MDGSGELSFSKILQDFFLVNNGIHRVLKEIENTLSLVQNVLQAQQILVLVHQLFHKENLFSLKFLQSSLKIPSFTWVL